MTLSISTQLQISLGLAKSHKRFTGTNRKFLLSLRTLPINLWHRITAAAKYHQLRSSQYTVLLDRIFPSLICQWETHFQTISKHICKVMTHAHAHAHAHAHTQPFNGLLSGTTRVGRYQKKYSPTHTHPDHRTSFIIFLHLQRSMTSSLFSLRADSPLGQPLSRSSLVFLLALDPQLHTPCISSPNHHHLHAAHAHTNAACFAAIPMLCHLYQSLSQLLTWESIF